ncbi:hypothetical protein Scep_007686 [Stephania cephalantha]|uniref:DNA mismatch repair proteins mutS family domain-containing protein n=1 Tax=Stephania cephalantha TaxID=152367 RepID=A0AAP0PNH5_9MAGN
MQQQRQRTIHSFFRKSSPENGKNSGVSASNSENALKGRDLARFAVKQECVDAEEARVPLTEDRPPEDVFGTDTPPEKLPRKVLPAKSLESGADGQSSLFSSIMHKFCKNEKPAESDERSQCRSSGHSSSKRHEEDRVAKDRLALCEIGAIQGLPDQQNLSRHFRKADVAEVSNYVDKVSSQLETCDGSFGPETPAMQPLGSRLKRIRDDDSINGNETASNVMNSSKRMKLLQELDFKNGKDMDVSEKVSSKFDWLNPSSIRDKNGNRPGEVLYDNRTLYIPPGVLGKMSASQKQYWSVKCQYMDVLLFFKVGKFYELYELDAEIAHKELDWKMTFSGVGKCRQVGISESGIDDAVQKLISRGYKVGRIEQLETSDQAKIRGGASVIQRKLVQVITPSTVTEGSIGPEAINLLSIKERSGSENGMTVYGFAFVDSASLKFWVGSISDDASGASLGALLMQVSPKEVIYEGRGLSKEAQKALKKYSSGTNSLQLTPAITDFMDASEVRNLIQAKGYFTGSFGSLGWDSALDGDIHQDLAVCALGGLVSHLSRLMLDDVLRNGDISSYHIYSGSLRIDGQSLANLEIFCNNADGGRKGTMYKYLDSCITSSGKRLLRSWICHPLKDVGEINRRLNAVEEFISHPEVILLVAEYLRKLPDMERLLGRVRAAVGSSTSLLVPLIGEKMLKQRIKCFCSLVKGLRVGVDLLSILHEKEHELSSLSKVLDVPTLNGSDGLDGLLLQCEAAADSEFSNVQGQAISGSDAETLSALTELFIENSTKWYQVIHALSCIDVLRSFAVAVNSSCGSMCRPVFLHASSGTGGPFLKIKGLWHPYASLGANVGTIVPNDIHLGGDSKECSPRTLLLTGPNMGGKSTLLRATCLAVILAQLGCYAPCEMCMLTPVDIIFTRLGATDRIMTGESTFFIECTETASVLQNATCDSLVILDELGRGTSTFDGYAIAYAVFRHLVENVKCRLLFATHYHSLTKEFASHPNVISQHMACALRPNDGSSSIDDKELIFLYRLSPGACPESYGLQVALMAGISKNVVEVAAKASQWLKGSIGKNFRSSEQRSEFSTLHEEWVKSLLCVARDSGRSFDEDACDTLLCLYHELKNFYQIGN